MTQAQISEYRLNIDTDIGYHPILYPISLTPIISVVASAVPDIGHLRLDIGPDIDTNIGYAVYDIGDRFTRYRRVLVSDKGVNIGVYVTRS